MPAVSVVLPVHNRARLLQTAIDSVLNQTFVDYEVIVVDDGSTEDLLADVPGLSHPKVRYFRQSNQGVAAARNNAISRARGAALVFLDSDDAFMPQGLQLLLSLDFHIRKVRQQSRIPFCDQQLLAPPISGFTHGL